MKEISVKFPQELNHINNIILGQVKYINVNYDVLKWGVELIMEKL